MRGRFIVNLLIAFIVGYLVANFIDIMMETEEFYECKLDRQADTMYITSRHQLGGDSNMIVMHRDGRTFMFKREDVHSCRGVER